MDTKKIVAAIENDAGQRLPGLAESIEEIKAGKHGRIHTKEQILMRKIRKQLGMTQAQFAQRIETPLKTYQQWEQGHSEPPKLFMVLLRAIEKYPDIIK